MTSVAGVTPWWEEIQVTPWWEEIQLREEVISSDGTIDDVQMSLHNAVFGKEGVGAGRTPYSSAKYFGEITHPTGTLVQLMGKVAVRLGAEGSTQTKSVWRLDQAMGGGKSHGLIGLWHLAAHPQELAATDLGEAVMREAEEIAGKGKIKDDLGNPICVVLDCDNTTATEEDFGPATRLGERFLWRLFERNYDRYNEYKEHTSNKAKLAEALSSTGRPVLILIDEVMDYLRVVSADDEAGAALDMAFLRALLDVVNDVPNCAAVVVMISSDADNIAMTGYGKEARIELEDLLRRNSATTAVTSGGDFAAIIQRRLFSTQPSEAAATQLAYRYQDAMNKGAWRSKVFDKLDDLYSGLEFIEQVERCYPFHPALIALAENEWSHQAGFQRVRSTIRVFAAAAYEQTRRAQRGDWVPPLIDSGDLTLRSLELRDAILGAGLIADTTTQSNLREVAGTDIADPHNDERGTARHLDKVRNPNFEWNEHNPLAAERMATALFIRSLCPRPQGNRGATEAELHAASFVLSEKYTPGDAEGVLELLLDPDDGLASADYTPGQGRSVPKRVFIETRKTLTMLTRAEKKAVSQEERDKAITERAFELASSGPFNEVINAEGEDVPTVGITAEAALGVIESASIDRKHKTRLVILDSRWFSLLNGDDSAARSAITAAMGVGQNAMSVQWASSAVFACANTSLRSQARGLAAEWLARKRVSEMPSVQADEESKERATKEAKEAKQQLDRKVRLCYNHIAFLAPKGDYEREVKFVRLKSDTQSALTGADVWGCLHAESKAFREGEFGKQALLHNLRDNDYGRPMSELRDSFWSNPHKPLLFSGTSELATAIYHAVTADEIELVNEDGTVYQVGSSGDINLGSQTIRIRKPIPADQVDTQPGPDTPTTPQPTPQPGPKPPGEEPDPPTKKQLQITIGINTSVNEDNVDDLYKLLTKVATRIDDLAVTHFNQTIQMMTSDDDEAKKELEELAKSLDGTMNVMRL